MDVANFGFDAGCDGPSAVWRKLQVFGEGVVAGGPAADGAAAEETLYVVEVAWFGYVYETCFSELHFCQHFIRPILTEWQHTLFGSSHECGHFAGFAPRPFVLESLRLGNGYAI